MFKHILIPTDGSDLSKKAIKKGIEFAKKIKARITTIHVVPEFRVIADESFVSLTPEAKKRFEEESLKRARKMLDSVVQQAKAQGVSCAAVAEANDLPYQQIIATAKSSKCDLILMASHGRRGIASVLLGSETAKVLTHSTIPVLVVR
ncbi:MAG TPA: universal stress protein [Burkholderiales bacterium]|jgi:nucleotide-binding universal stress UspA family protein|nr:universal stress protein [Burkholderiales bacterium]